MQSAAGENFNIVLPPDAQQPVLLQGWIQGPVAAEMFKRAGHDLAELRRRARTAAFKPIDLKATFSANAGVDLNRITTRNVIGKLTGSKYPDETVSYGGHWDAYGIGPADAQGRTIRPGASDDALGLAAMIEIARLFAAGPRPERTLVFAAWTAEERGLLGSEYYAQHPLYPHETMVANLTLDTLQTAGAVKDVVLIGQGQSEMERLLAEAAQAQGRYVTPENHPERGLFYRADHFSLAKRGVPVLLNMALAGVVRPRERRTRGRRSLAQRVHGQLLPPAVRRLVGELGPQRRGSGGASCSTPSARGSPTAASGRNGRRPRNSRKCASGAPPPGASLDWRSGSAARRRPWCACVVRRRAGSCRPAASFSATRLLRPPYRRSCRAEDRRTGR